MHQIVSSSWEKPHTTTRIITWDFCLDYLWQTHLYCC